MPSSSNNEGFVLGRLSMDASFQRPHSLVWLLSRVLLGEGEQTIEFREECIWPGANSTIRAGADNSISVLGYRQPDNLSRLSSYLQPVPWKASYSDTQTLSLWAQERMQSWRGCKAGEDAKLERMGR